MLLLIVYVIEFIHWNDEDVRINDFEKAKQSLFDINNSLMPSAEVFFCAQVQYFSFCILKSHLHMQNITNANVKPIKDEHISGKF